MRRVHRGAVALSCVAMLTAQLAHAANRPLDRGQVADTSLIQDVALQTGGRLYGQISDVQGMPQAAVQVAVIQNGTLVATALTDGNGQFEITRLPAGVYEVRTPESVRVYRAWAPGTAPPSARQGVLLVAGQQVVRGGGMVASPYGLALIVAAAIAIPLALDSSS